MFGKIKILMNLMEKRIESREVQKKKKKSTYYDCYLFRRWCSKYLINTTCCGICVERVAMR